MTQIPNVVTIAGSDSGGGAGIQADLKTFSALGTFGASVVTALTAQNTHGVRASHAPPPEFVGAQIDAVFEDLDVAAVKIGMLGSPALIEAVAAGLDRHRPAHVVLDPVMVAKGGDPLLPEDAVEALRTVLVPRATVITPNLPEAGVLVGRPAPEDEAGMRALLGPLAALGAEAVLLKGGHLVGEEAVDLLMHGGDVTRLAGARITTRNTHGTGCSLSSAIAAGLARGASLVEAVRAAKGWLTGAIAHADDLSVGRGHGPVHHFHALRR